jgi:hypothetical protein
VSRDVDATLQLLFICGGKSDFITTEELAYVQSTLWTTTGENVFQVYERTVVEYETWWTQLKCVTTDGDRNMT